LAGLFEEQVSTVAPRIPAEEKCELCSPGVLSVSLTSFTPLSNPVNQERIAFFF
jgi:hypothetical protein